MPIASDIFFDLFGLVESRFSISQIRFDLGIFCFSGVAVCDFVVHVSFFQ